MDYKKEFEKNKLDYQNEKMDDKGFAKLISRQMVLHLESGGKESCEDFLVSGMACFAQAYHSAFGRDNLIEYLDIFVELAKETPEEPHNVIRRIVDDEVSRDELVQTLDASKRKMH